jgi:hypothetical protein
MKKESNKYRQWRIVKTSNAIVDIYLDRIKEIGNQPGAMIFLEEFQDVDVVYSAGFTDHAKGLSCAISEVKLDDMKRKFSDDFHKKSLDDILELETAKQAVSRMNATTNDILKLALQSPCFRTKKAAAKYLTKKLKKFT